MLINKTTDCDVNSRIYPNAVSKLARPLRLLPHLAASRRRLSLTTKLEAGMMDSDLLAPAPLSRAVNWPIRQSSGAVILTCRRSSLVHHLGSSEPLKLSIIHRRRLSLSGISSVSSRLQDPLPSRRGGQTRTSSPSLSPPLSFVFASLRVNWRPEKAPFLNQPEVWKNSLNP